MHMSRNMSRDMQYMYAFMKDCMHQNRSNSPFHITGTRVAFAPLAPNPSVYPSDQ